MGRGAEASEPLLTSICSGADSSEAGSWGERRMPGTRGLRGQPSPDENLTGLEKRERERERKEGECERRPCPSWEDAALPQRCSGAAHDPPGGADFGLKGELLLDVFQDRRRNVGEALDRGETEEAGQVGGQAPGPALGGGGGSRCFTRKAWLALSLRVESSGLSTGVWLVNLESNWLTSSADCCADTAQRLAPARAHA